MQSFKFSGRHRPASSKSSQISTESNASSQPTSTSQNVKPKHPPGKVRTALSRSINRLLSREPTSTSKSTTTGNPTPSPGVVIPTAKPNTNTSPGPSTASQTQTPATTPGSSAAAPVVTALPAHQIPDSNDLWEDALKTLSEEDQQALNFGNLEKLDILNKVLEATTEKRDICVQRQWKFIYNGQVIILRDLADKLLAWVEKFKQIGDIIIQYDPTHAALPWAGFRFLLQVIGDDNQKMGAILVGLEKIAILLDRCMIYENLYLKPSTQQPPTKNLERALIKLYASILLYLARAKQYYGKNTAVRIASGIFDIEGFQPFLDDIDSSETGVRREADLAEASYHRAAHEEIGDQVTKLRIILNDLEKPIMRIDSKVAALHDGLQDSYRTEILLWLSKIPYKKHHERAREGRVENTGVWLLQKAVYKHWKASSMSTILWLHGIPGAGKTKLTSLIIDVILNDLKTRKNTEGFAYFYCNRNETERQDPDCIFRAIVKQLCYLHSGGFSLHKSVIREYEARKQDGFSSGDLGLRESTKLIIELMDLYPQTTIVIDGLDECDRGTREYLLEALKEIVQTSSSLAKIFVSSRNDSDIILSLNEVPNLYIEASDNAEDITRFVDVLVNECIQRKRLLGGNVRKELKEQICTTISRDAKGMFLWADLQIKNMCDMSMESDVIELLGKLPATLEETYREIFESKIGSERGNGPRLAHLAMMWIMCSCRPLSSDELVEASVLSLRLSSNRPTAPRDVNSDIILRLCHNLVVIDHQRGVMTFAHLSVQEFLETSIWNIAEINAMAAEMCIALLLEPEKWSQTKSTDNDSVNKTIAPGNHLSQLQKSLLGTNSTVFKYSIVYWPVHIQRCGDGRSFPRLLSSFMNFFGSFETPGLGYVSWLETYYKDWPGDSVPQHGNPHMPRWRDTLTLDNKIKLVFAASWFGFGEIIKPLWDSGTFDVNMKNDRKEPLLYIASAGGTTHEWVIKFLLEHGADVNATGGYFQTALRKAACQKTHESIVRLLITRGADVNYQYSRETGPALRHAAFGGCNNIAQILLENGADANLGDPLQAATFSGHNAVIRTLLKYGANPDPKSPIYDTPYESAALGDQVETLEILLSQIKANSTNGQIPSRIRSSILSAAIRANSLKTIRYCVEEARGDINSGIFGKKTPLHQALELRSVPIIEYLLAQGSNLSLELIHTQDLEWARGEPWYPELIDSIMSKKSAQENRPLTPLDVLRARLILHKGARLPLQVADSILDLAEYWVHTRCTRQEHLSFVQGDPDVPYVQLSIHSRLKSPVRRIIFYIRSHDQGFGGHESDVGTYRGSFTWFEAGIEAGILNPKGPDIPRRTIQSNVVASRETRGHTIVLDVGDTNDFTRWVEKLSSGQVLGVYPKAQYPGWRNYVYQIDVDLYCAWV